jgi:hypothetical protein
LPTSALMRFAIAGALANAAAAGREVAKAPDESG